MVPVADAVAEVSEEDGADTSQSRGAREKPSHETHARIWPRQLLTAESASGGIRPRRVEHLRKTSSGAVGFQYVAMDPRQSKPYVAYIDPVSGGSERMMHLYRSSGVSSARGAARFKSFETWHVQWSRGSKRPCETTSERVCKRPKRGGVQTVVRDATEVVPETPEEDDIPETPEEEAENDGDVEGGYSGRRHRGG